MVDWTATEHRFGVRSDTAKTRDRVVVVCGCGATADVLYRVALKHLHRRGHYCCHDCLTKSPEFRAACSERAKRKWADPDYRANNLAVVQSTDWRQRNRLRAQAYWDAPEHRVAHAIALSRLGPRQSNIQHTLYRYLADLGVEFVPEGPGTTIGPFVFDCLVPNLGAGKHLLIECQGEYWHTKPAAASRDRSKFTYIDRYFPEYEIMYIWEHEFAAKDGVLDRLRLKLGKAPPTKSFRLGDVVVEQSGRKDINSFLDAYHYIGKGRGGLAYAGRLGDQMIACAAYCYPLRQNTAAQFGLEHRMVRELSRLCIHPSYHKQNFASWFIARTRSRLDARLVVAYADTTLGHRGTVYRAAGFELDHEVPPDYWYVGPEGYVMHKKTLYDHAVRLGKSEAAYAAEFGYARRWGGKKLCFVWRRTSGANNDTDQGS